MQEYAVNLGDECENNVGLVSIDPVEQSKHDDHLRQKKKKRKRECRTEENKNDHSRSPVRRKKLLTFGFCLCVNWKCNECTTTNCSGEKEKLTVQPQKQSPEISSKPPEPS